MCNHFTQTVLSWKFSRGESKTREKELADYKVSPHPQLQWHNNIREMSNHLTNHCGFLLCLVQCVSG